MSSESLFDATPEPMKRRRRPKKSSAPVFKHCATNEQMLLPPNMEDLIPPHHLVRVVNAVIDKMHIERLLERHYKGGGTSAYVPTMMVKVITYAYCSKVYASRQIAKALRQDVSFMWLAGMNRPDFHTINNFRSSTLKAVIDEVFTAMVTYLSAHNYIDLRHYFVDGTKIAADANRHTPVWRKNTKRHKERLQQHIKEHLDYIDTLSENENKEYGDRDLEELGDHTSITSASINEQAEKLRKRIEERSQPPRARQALKKLTTTMLPKLRHYEQQEALLAGRNSYSRTDPDATFFRTQTGELLPMYNVMMGTQNQFVVHYSIHQKASETDQFISHLEQAATRFGHYPQNVVGDAAYGSEDNYRFLETNTIGNYLKYNTFHRKQKPKRFAKEQFVYDATSDTYQCPDGRSLTLDRITPSKTPAGTPTQLRIYASADCTGCPLRTQCIRGEGPRTLTVNPQWEVYREQARINLESDTGIRLRIQRSTDVEPTFGDIKGNGGYRRFRLRGKEKVAIEFGLLSISHNIKKIALRPT